MIYKVLQLPIQMVGTRDDGDNGDLGSVSQGNFGLMFLPGTSERNGDRLLSHGHSTMLKVQTSFLLVQKSYA